MKSEWIKKVGHVVEASGTKIGAGLLVVALVLTWMAETGLAYGALIAAGVIDLYLVIRRRQTISQWIQRLWPKKIDYPVLAALLTYTFTMTFKQYGVIAGLQAALPWLVVVLLLHLFADKK